MTHRDAILPRATILEIKKLSGADEQSVRRRLSGLPGRRSVQARIDVALRTLGHGALIPTAAQEAVGAAAVKKARQDQKAAVKAKPPVAAKAAAPAPPSTHPNVALLRGALVRMGFRAPDIQGDGRFLRNVWKVRRSARGCYHVGPLVFPFLWIAANELPLRDDLVPFLVARSGRALDEFGRWVAKRRPAEWVLDMVQYTAMSTSARAQVINSVETDDPEVVARQVHLVQLLFAKHPELQQKVTNELRAAERKEGRKEGRRKGRLAEARAILRRVLARRGLELTADDETRIDVCTTLATLEHWIDEAVVTSSAAEALGLPRQV